MLFCKRRPAYALWPVFKFVYMYIFYHGYVNVILFFLFINTGLSFDMRHKVTNIHKPLKKTNIPPIITIYIFNHCICIVMMYWWIIMHNASIIVIDLAFRSLCIKHIQFDWTLEAMEMIVGYTRDVTDLSIVLVTVFLIPLTVHTCWTLFLLEPVKGFR